MPSAHPDRYTQIVTALEADRERGADIGTSPAVDAGVRAVFRFPVKSGGVSLGALDVYLDQPGDLNDGQLADAVTLTGVISRTLPDIQATRRPAYSQGLSRRASSIAQSYTRPRGWCRCNSTFRSSMPCPGSGHTLTLKPGSSTPWPATACNAFYASTPNLDKMATPATNPQATETVVLPHG